VAPSSPSDRRRATRQATRAAVDAAIAVQRGAGGESASSAGRDGDPSRSARPRSSGPGDPLSAVLRRAGVVRLLVLQLMSPEGSDGDEPAYGSWLIERIREVSGGLVTVNPNTMYPLLRALEDEGLVEGSWEHPVRRSRRFYRITAAGVAERERLRADVLPALDDVASAVAALRDELAS
jgi:PadR family transcriptional regulator PadR